VLPERAAAAKNSILANFRSLGKADIIARLADRILAIITEQATALLPAAGPATKAATGAATGALHFTRPQ